MNVPDRKEVIGMVNNFKEDLKRTMKEKKNKKVEEGQIDAKKE